MSETTKKVLQRFMRLQRLLHRYQFQSFMSFGPWGNPNRGQGRVLSILKMKPEISQKELTYLLDMSKQALAELLAKLEKSGYIVRETSEEDRRSVIIRLTEAGAAVAGEMDDSMTGLEKLFDCLSEEEQASLGDYLQRVIDKFDEQAAGDEEDWHRRMMEMNEKFMHHVHRCEGHGHHYEEDGHCNGHGPGFNSGLHGYFGGGFRSGWGCGPGGGEK